MSETPRTWQNLMPITNVKVKPCPFCGEFYEVGTMDDAVNHFGVCLSCGAKGPKHQTKHAALEAWNKAKRLDND